MDFKDKGSHHDNVKVLSNKVGKIKTAMLTTYTSEEGFHSRPIGTAEVDADGNLWFFTNEFSEDDKEISIDDKVSVTYEDNSSRTYLSIKGKALLVDDKAKMKKLWTSYIKTFFPKGVNDPKLTLLKVETSDLEYWETSSIKIVILFDMLKINVLGEPFDEGAHGKIQW
jgi:general stress protein 26